MAKVKQTVYSKERKRIMAHVNRMRKKGIYIEAPQMPTERELRQSGIKGSELGKLTRQLKKLTARQLNKTQQPLYQEFDGVTVDVSTGEIVEDRRSRYQPYEGNKNYVVDTETGEILSRQREIEGYQMLDLLTGELHDIPHSSTVSPDAPQNGSLYDMPVEHRTLFERATFYYFKESYSYANETAKSIIDNWLNSQISQHGETAVAEAINEAENNGIKYEHNYGYDGKLLAQFLLDISRYLPEFGDFSRDALLESIESEMGGDFEGLV